jgi:hypothetical protein
MLGQKPKNSAAKVQQKIGFTSFFYFFSKKAKFLYATWFAA